MKTEEHHPATTNEFGQAIQAFGHRLEEHATKIVLGICAVLVIAAAVIWWSRQTSATAVAAWTLLESAETVEQYGHIVDTYKGTPPGRWAKLRESEIYLQTGMSQMFTNRELALADVKKAREGFELLAGDKAVEPPILERALWGLAAATESTSDADTGKAIAVYQRLLDEVPETFYKPVVEQRITALKTGGAKEFYAWFSKQAPKPAEARPKDGSAKDELDSLIPSPGKSEFNLDPLPKSTDDKSAEGKSPAETPAQYKPTGDKPSGDKPVEGAGKDTPKPDQPADESKKPDATKPEAKPEPAKEGAAKPEEKPATDKGAEPKADKDAEKKE